MAAVHPLTRLISDKRSEASNTSGAMPNASFQKDPFKAFLFGPSCCSKVMNEWNPTRSAEPQHWECSDMDQEELIESSMTDSMSSCSSTRPSTSRGDSKTVVISTTSLQTSKVLEQCCEMLESLERQIQKIAPGITAMSAAPDAESVPTPRRFAPPTGGDVPASEMWKWSEAKRQLAKEDLRRTEAHARSLCSSAEAVKAAAIAEAGGLGFSTGAQANAQSSATAISFAKRLRAARDALAAAIVQAKQAKFPQEEVHAAETLRRKMHNLIQDLQGQIRVYCRLRPLNENERKAGDTKVVRPINGAVVEVAGSHPDRYHFDAVFSPGTQEEVFLECQGLTQTLVDGHNVSVVSYGQTGAGKTHTMYGTKQEPGVAVRLASQLFEVQQQERNFTVTGSVLELHNNRITDLLAGEASFSSGGGGLHHHHHHHHHLEAHSPSGSSPSSSRSPSHSSSRRRSMPVPSNSSNNNSFGFGSFGPAASWNGAAQSQGLTLSRRDPEGEPTCEGMTEVPLASVQELKEMVALISERRAVSAHALNSQSSRSHVLLTLKIHRVPGPSTAGLPSTSKLLLCDLGGCERLKRSEAAGEQVREAIEINKSLSALGDVVEAVVQKRRHIPYRNHKLTQLLQDSLGGSAKALFFINCSPASSSASETAAALAFAARAQRVTNPGAPGPVMSSGRLLAASNEGDGSSTTSFSSSSSTNSEDRRMMIL